MTQQNNIKIEKPYFQNLDALRFFAAFAVFIFHFFQEFNVYFIPATAQTTFKLMNVVLSKGALGVNFFFVLSGFLITYLILFEIQQKGNFQLKNFLIRRTLRIWPLYFLIMLIGFVIFPVIIPGYSTVHNPWYYVFFLANFDEINHGLQDAINFLTAPWSVAVEEQFYLFWGVALSLLFKTKKFKLNHLLLLIWLLSIGFTLLHIGEERILYYHTFSVMSNIVIGGFLAQLTFNKNTFLMGLKNMPKYLILLVYLAGFTIILLKNKIFIGPMEVLEQSIISLFFAFVILEQVYLKNAIFKVGKIKFFNHLGKISYGLYLYHLIIMYLIQRFISPHILDNSPVFNLALLLSINGLATYFLAALSYLYFEKPFLSIKKNFT
ncbi:acyltransferase family protein [Putridiphycobacter roseus]|uniref:acyltransferase family protein n=1 Tax=Putridiphycobacter roseus TaxID=2219161 RepID=UPI0013144A25|nr:acyltransferase [Putridiphycobacter roseus]